MSSSWTAEKQRHFLDTYGNQSRQLASTGLDEISVAREMKAWCRQNGYGDTVRGQNQTEAEIVKVHNRYLSLSLKGAYGPTPGAIERFEALSILDL
jgi:hypothetical protein